VSLSFLSNEAILRYHANMRSMVALDIGVDGRTFFGELARKRAQYFEDEMTQRGIYFEPIVWPET